MVHYTNKVPDTCHHQLKCQLNASMLSLNSDYKTQFRKNNDITNAIPFPTPVPYSDHQKSILINIFFNTKFKFSYIQITSSKWAEASIQCLY